MSRTLWIIKVSGQYAGRTWQPVTYSEYDVRKELEAAGYGPDLSIELGEVPEAVQAAMAQL